MQAVAKHVLVVDGYIRQPRAIPGNNRPASALRAQTKSAAARRGWRIARIIEESDGSRQRDQALLRIESGEIDGMIVARLADLGASLPEAVAAIDRIRAAGGTLLSVSERIELGPHTGALIWRLLIALADY